MPAAPARWISSNLAENKVGVTQPINRSNSIKVGGQQNIKIETLRSLTNFEFPYCAWQEIYSSAYVAHEKLGQGQEVSGNPWGKCIYAHARYCSVYTR
jgi:hypothetical protein